MRARSAVREIGPHWSATVYPSTSSAVAPGRKSRGVDFASNRDRRIGYCQQSRRELSRLLAASPSFPFVINSYVCHLLGQPTSPKSATTAGKSSTRRFITGSTTQTLGRGIRQPARTRTWAGKGGGTRPGSTTGCAARGKPVGEALSPAGPMPSTAPRGAGSGPAHSATAAPPDGHRSCLRDPRLYWGFEAAWGVLVGWPCRKL